MKAITYAQYGPPEVLQLADVAKPVPKDNEVLIRVRAAEATKSDCEMRSFKFSVKWFWLPLRIALGVRKPKRQILGSYFAGEIESVGHDVRQLAISEFPKWRKSGDIAVFPGSIERSGLYRSAVLT